MNDDSSTSKSAKTVLQMASEIVSAYVSHNALPAAHIPELIQTVYKSLADMERPQGDAAKEPLKPAVPPRRSITPEHIICLEDGKRLKMLNGDIFNVMDQIVFLNH